MDRKKAYSWFKFFSELPYGEELMADQQEILFDTLNEIEQEVEAQNDVLRAEIKDLKSLCGRTFYVGPDDKFPRGCKSCLLGNGLSAIRKSNKCNAKCKFCYDYGQLDCIPPIGEGMWEIGGTKYYEKDIDLLLSIYKKPTGISYVYLEPFTEIEKYYGVIRKFKDAGVYQHMYTNGINANEENLKALGEAGLDELRFNLGASNCSDKVINNMKIAAKYIPAVGIETPMTPEFFSQFEKKKEAILSSGIRFINCAELHLNENNIGNYEGELMYMTRLGYISPIWSHQLTLKFMKIASDEGWDIVVHDCSNFTKFARDINLRAKEGGWFGASSYGCEFEVIPYEVFLPYIEKSIKQ